MKRDLRRLIVFGLILAAFHIHRPASPLAMENAPAPSLTLIGDAYKGTISALAVGDVNGDGYSDLVVGADDYDGGRGKVYVYRGGLAGLTAAALLAKAGVSVTLYEKSKRLGGRAQTTTREGYQLNLRGHGQGYRIIHDYMFGASIGRQRSKCLVIDSNAG